MFTDAIFIKSTSFQLDSRASKLKLILLPVTVLALITSALTLIFQCFALQGYCFSKLSVIFLGNVLFWSFSALPLVRITRSIKQQSLFISKWMALGVATLAVNQFLVLQLIDLVFQYGFGCSDYRQNWSALLVENNLLSNIFLFVFFSLIGFIKTGKAEAKTQSHAEETNTKNEQNGSFFQNYISTLPVKTGSVTTKVQLNEVLYIEADNNTITLVTDARKFVLYRSLSSLQKELNPGHFVRIHRSTVLNKNFVHKIHHHSNGDGTVELKNGITLRMSRHYKTKTAVLA